MPTHKQASDLAGLLRPALYADGQSLEDLVVEMGWSVTYRPLLARSGGLQALMAPQAGGFMFVIDPHPTPEQLAGFDPAGDPASQAQWVRRFRLAHELAHVFFHGVDGSRLAPRSTAEERFCDAFAAALVGDRTLILAAA